ncbi:hypothetical protein DYB31_001281 [Aphanomyces astaci]|uniref:Uncharacterized protein n=1 Tax=Aphanomyces astaci TaxID=112090 RepID=A0A397FLE2_APHAT|nr:hypothetical protein DYB31_001281 [Aphanomyces astaci]
MAHLENEYLTKKYQKWDHFEDDEEDGMALPASAKPTQYDHAGDADITIVDQMLLTPAQLQKYKRMDQTKSEIWQIVVRKLRVWSASSEGAAEGDEAIPCRPYAILVNNIYPLGQVFYEACAKYAELQPWRRLVERQAIQIDATTSLALNSKPQSSVWGARELSVFYGNITAVPFDDLDAIDKLNCRIAKDPDGSGLYPTPILFRHGEATLPTGADLLWLVRGLQAVIHMTTTYPNFVNATMPELLGLTDDESKLTLPISTMTGEEENVVVRNSSEMETLLGLESQSTCAWSECEEAREAHEAQYASLRAKLAAYTHTIAEVPVASHHPNWAILRDMVDNQLPKFLAHLQVKINANDAKARHIREQLDLVRQKRLAVQDLILQLESSTSIPTPTSSASSA